MSHFQLSRSEGCFIVKQTALQSAGGGGICTINLPDAVTLGGAYIGGGASPVRVQLQLALGL